MKMLNDDVDVCSDCYEDHHAGRAMKDDSVDWTDNTGDEEDGYTTFSRSWCQCCGTTMAGVRLRMAIWEKEG